MLFSEIPQMPFTSYVVNIDWKYLKQWFNDVGCKVDLNPDYQRGYKWTEQQKVAYIEYILKGGFSGKDIFWNNPTWERSSSKQPDVLELVDGQQRLKTVLEFLDDKIKVFDGSVCSEMGKIRMIKTNFVFHINNLQTRKDVIEWYLGMNTGGSIHTDEDLKVAYEALEKETLNV